MSEEMQLELELTLKTMRKLKEAKAEIERLRAALGILQKAMDLIRAEVLEEAATLAMRYDDASFAAAAIRALKDKQHDR